MNLTAGPTLNVVLGAGFTSPTGSAFTVIPGATAGTFNGLQNGANFNSGGIFFRINYGSVILTPLGAPITIPTLSTWGLALLAILLALLASGKLPLPRGTKAP